MKTQVDTVEAIPSKRLYLSIISDYDLFRSICELVDNALDIWKLERKSKKQKVLIDLQLDCEQQTIIVKDNAGGIAKEDLSLVVSPGRSSNEPNNNIIGIFGVGSKRAVVALAETIKIFSRKEKYETFLIEFDNDWIQDDDTWELPVYKTQRIDESTTIISLSSLRKKIEEDDINLLRSHLEATYGKFLKNKNVNILLNDIPLKSKEFEKWAFPPNYHPKKYKGEIPIKDEKNGIVKTTIIGGLVGKGEPAGGEFGVYFYCNDRLVAKALKNYEVGFSSGNAGNVSHLNLVRVIVYLKGGAKLMPWNSSKSDIDTKHKVFLEIRHIIVQLVTHYASLSRRFESSWEENVFQYKVGDIPNTKINNISQSVKLRLPSLPRVRRSFEEKVKLKNRELSKKKPWTTGLYESIIAVDKISKLKLNQKGRILLVLLDSTIEISFKEYLVNEIKIPQGDSGIKKLFTNRKEVHRLIKEHIDFEEEEWNNIEYFYKQRCDLIHQKATSEVSVEQIQNFRMVVESVLAKMFELKFD